MKIGAQKNNKNLNLSHRLIFSERCLKNKKGSYASSNMIPLVVTNTATRIKILQVDIFEVRGV